MGLIGTTSGEFGTPTSTGGGGGTTSPLTTKGDLFGFDTTNNRVPVGADGFILMGDSTQSLGVGYSTRNANFNGHQAINATALQVVGPLGGGRAGLVDINDNNTYTSGNQYFAFIMTGVTPTFTTTNLQTLSAFMQNAGSFTINAISGKSSILGMDYFPNIKGSAPPGVVSSWDINTTFGTQSTVPSGLGMHVFPVVASGCTLTSYKGMSVDSPSNNGTITTMVAADIAFTGSATGGVTTPWGLQAGLNCRFSGSTTFGGSSVPQFAVDIQQGTPGACFRIASSTTAPTVPNVALLSGGGAAIDIYEGTGGVNTYFLIAVNDAGTTRYSYLNLHGAGNAWVTGATVLPT